MTTTLPVAEQRLVGRITGGHVADLTVAQIKTLLALANTDISGLGTLATLNAVGSTEITDGSILNADINAAAGIALSKLATDPLARANHTGTQLMATISDAGTAATKNTGTGSTNVILGNDSRLTDSRAPTTHASTHQNSGSDEIATATAAANAIPKAGSGGTLAIGWVPTGSSASTVCIGNDSRLSDSRVPSGTAGGDLGGSYPNPTISGLALSKLAVQADKTFVGNVSGGSAAPIAVTAANTLAALSGASGATFSWNTQAIGNISTVGIGATAPTGGAGSSSFLLGGSQNITTSTYQAIRYNESVTLTGSTGLGTNSFLTCNPTWTTSNSVATTQISCFDFLPTFNLGTSATLTAFNGIRIQPSFSSAGTTTTANLVLINPAVGSGATVTAMNGLAIASVNSGTLTTMVGIDLGVTNALAGSTIWAMKVGSYNSYFNGSTTFGGTATPAYAVHLQGGNAATNYVGATTSTTGPADPGSNAGMAVGLYKGTNYFFIIRFNDGGTTRYKYLQLNGTGTTWTAGTALPT